MTALGPALLASPAVAVPYHIEEWSVEVGEPGAVYLRFSDDFEDGHFAAVHYDTCGDVLPGDESGGTLAIGGGAMAGGACGWEVAQTIAADFLFADSVVIEASLSMQEPAEGEVYGIRLSNLAGTDFVGLVLTVSEGETLALWIDDAWTGGDTVGDPGVHVVGYLDPSRILNLTLEIDATADAGVLRPALRLYADEVDDASSTFDFDVPPLDLALSEGFRGELVAATLVPEPGAEARLGAAGASLAALAWLGRRRAKRR